MITVKKNSKLFLFLIISLLMLGMACRPSKSSSRFSYQNPISKGIDKNGLRDCQVIKEGDWWYLTGTSFPHWSRQEEDGQLNDGVALYKSKNLLEWKFVDFIVKRPNPNKWYHRRFWAPEIQKIKGKFYATFNCRNDSMGYVGQFGGYAVADQIEGPYKVVTEDKPLTQGNDLTFFEDDDDKVWAFWNRGREFGIGFAQVDLENAIFLTEKQSAIRPGKVDYATDANGKVIMERGYDGRPRKKIAAYHSWDAIGIEGAYVIKEKGIYYLFFSSWTRGYEIGYATATNIQGPWMKYEGNPFYGAMKRETTESRGFKFEGDSQSPFNAVGHNQVFLGPGGGYWLSCHGIKAGGSPFLVIDPIWFENGQIKSNGPTYEVQEISW